MKALLGGLALLVLSACSHIPQWQTVQVTSNPPGATVYVHGLPIGQTPLVMDTDPRKLTEIRIEKECYQPYTFTLRPQWVAYGVPVARVDGSPHAELQPTCPPVAAKEIRP